MGNILKGSVIAATGYFLAKAVEAGVNAIISTVKTSADAADKNTTKKSAGRPKGSTKSESK